MKLRVFLLLLFCSLFAAAAPREFTIDGKLWRCYSKGKVIRKSANEFRIIDSVDADGAGLIGTLKVKAGERLSFSGAFKAVNSDVEKLYVQIRFMPQKKIVQQEFLLKAGEDFKTISFNFPSAPTGSTQAMVYVYVQPGKNEFLLRDLKVEPARVEKFDVSKLKARRKFMLLSSQTVLVVPEDGSADAAVNALLASVPVKFKVLKQAPAAGTYSSCIIIGNRNNNKLISDLYDRYFLIADSYYPGRGGHQLRTILNPGGTKADYLLVSGSGNAETQHAIELLQKKLQSIPAAGGKIKVPFFWDVKLSPDHKLSSSVLKTHTFDESEGYGTRFYGWNVLARYMALFYSTGDEKYARRFLDLAFRKTEDARAELARDPGTFKLINDPIAGPYHYNAIMMNLFWDMIEDHPVFSDAERVDVAEAMFRQFLFWRDTSNGCNVYNNFSPAVMIGNRHGQWAAMSLYSVARYLNKVMPSNEYIHSMKAAENFYDSIKKYYYVMGEGGNLTWFPSGNESVPFFMLLAGWKDKAQQSGLLTLYHALETLCGNAHGKRIRYYMPLSLLRRTAYLLDDNAPIELEKRLQEHFNVHTFRLGQSFAPAKTYRNNRPTPVQKWNFIKPSKLEKLQWRMPFDDTENGFSIASWRQDNERGDLIIIDGHLDQISRQPLHAMTIFTLSLADLPLIAGYRNQLWARHDGLSFSAMPNSAHLEGTMSLSSSAGFVSSLNISDSLNWQRSLLKVNDFCIVADRLEEKSSQAKQYSIDAVWEFAPGLEDKVLNDHQIGLVSNDLQANSQFFVGALNSKYSVKPADGEIIRLSGGVPSVLFKAQNPGEQLAIEFNLPKAFSGSAILRMYAFKDRGKFNVYIDNKLVKSNIDHYAALAGAVNIKLDNIDLTVGKHLLTLEAAAPSEGGTMSIAFSAFALVLDNAEPRAGSLSFAGNAKVRRESHKATVNDLLTGKVAVFTFKTKLQPGEQRSFFTLIGSRSAKELDCFRLSDNAALLTVPEKAVAVQNEYEALNISGQLVMLSAKQLCGIKVLKAGTIFEAPEAVDINWSLISGKAEIFAASSMSVTLGSRSYQLQAGLNKLECKVSGNDLQKLRAELDALQGEKNSAGELDSKLNGNARKAVAQAAVGTYPANMIAFDGILAVAAGKKINIFTEELKLIKSIEVGSEVGKLAYAADSKLLLAGCGDGKVIAYSSKDYRRVWEHVSVEADGLSETGAHWYLKSTFPGIYGLKAGRFAGNSENIFVGSASTLEVLTSNGKLLKRFKILWGPIQHFEFFTHKNSQYLLLSQLYPGSDYLTKFDTKFNSKIGYNQPPQGKLFFANWMGINRTGITAVDLDKNGETLIVSGLNGVWNRIIVWNADGKPLREVSFGIGDSLKIPPYGRERSEKRHLYDAVVVKTARRNYIAAATSEALILFDNNLKKIWSRQLPDEPLITVAAGSTLVSGLRNGQLCFYNLAGKLVNVNSNKAAWVAMLLVNGSVFAADANGNIYKFNVK